MVDEALFIPDIEITLKLKAGYIPEVQLFIYSSLSIEMAIKINEPLTERKIGMFFIPCFFQKTINYHGLI